MKFNKTNNILVNSIYNFIKKTIRNYMKVINSKPKIKKNIN